VRYTPPRSAPPQSAPRRSRPRGRSGRSGGRIPPGRRRRRPRGKPSGGRGFSCSWLLPLRPAWRGADAHADDLGAESRLWSLAVGEAAGLGGRVVASAPRHGAFAERRLDPLPDVAGEVVDAEGAARGGMGSHLVRTEGARLLAVGQVEIGVVGLQDVPVRELAVVGAAGGALPLLLGAEARAGHAVGAIE